MTRLMCAVALTACLLAPLAQALDVGDPVPELAISKVIKGDDVKGTYKDRGQITVVEFWATWCGPCRQSIPHLTELQKKYADKNVRIIGITDEAEAQVKGFVPREEWLPFSDPELQTLAAVRRWLGAARFDAVRRSRPVLVWLCEERLSSHPSL